MFSLCQFVAAAASSGLSFRTAHEERWSKTDRKIDIQIGIVSFIQFWLNHYRLRYRESYLVLPG